jgi:hypothetical protein
MSLFNSDSKQKFNKEVSVDSALGRGATSIAKAKKELFFKPPRVNPVDKIAVDDRNYYGENHFTKESYYVDDSEVTHEILIGSTGTGKFCPFA